MTRAAGISSNTVPWEILRAAGYAPSLMDGDAEPTPYADRFMESVFNGRIRVIFDRLCSGAWKHLELVVFSRASEQEHKLYLYLREAARMHGMNSIPRLYLYNLLHTRTPESFTYGLERTRQMARDFEVPENRLQESIVEGNRARAAVRQILMRRRDGRLEGSAAMRMLRAFYTESRERFPETVHAQLPALELAASVRRPRILIKGVSLDDDVLHRLVEKSGGYVLAEDDWRGSRAAGEQDIRIDSDPVAAIFEKYFYDAVSPRVHPAAEADSWFCREIDSGEVDGVLFYLPLEDDVAGWDYPRHLDFLRTRSVPSLVVRTVAEAAAAVSAFIENLRRRQS
jgi:benzoyl-CoA reductase/2-hydroxyglutaryl-CoA dehydratase subunit BcrC/BadD/HgdB